MEHLEVPLVFIVDELDRCKPEFSIKLIERIKHFFDIPNIVFVLSTNKSQLEESINSFYGFKSANSYLEKFIDLNLKFPNKKTNDYDGVIQAYTQKFNLNVRIADIILLSKIYNLNSRDLIRVLQKMALFNNYSHNVSLIMAFIYLAMEQKSMNPSQMSETKFLDNFMELLRDYTKNTPSFSRNSYDYENLVNFANQYGENYRDYDSGLVYLLKYYYVQYTDEPLDEQSQKFKSFKSSLMANGTYGDQDFVKSWDNYINCGFIVG